MHVPDLTPHLEIPDHSVSHELFTVFRSERLDLLATHPQPAAEALGRYYESDDYISHTDGKRSLFERVYHLVKSYALQQKCRLISRFAAKGKLLDIGAGTGDFLATALAQGWDVTGFEPNAKAAAIAQAKGVSLTNTTSALPDGTFSAITMWHVLEHVPDPKAQLDELYRLLQPGGFAFVAVPNFKSYDASYYGTFWAAYDVPRHLWHFSQTAIRALATESSFELVDVLPMKFDAFYVSLLSEKYQNGRMRFLPAFRVGWRSNRKAKRTGQYSSLIYVLEKAINDK
ncbi:MULTISPECIES: class I SAM-dependent methyltransferase [unclassified Flavobacterium]|uniref:class I SAM-dependent methyltransferase n=1 Tax=unclassified Flavobacterium TaxID=196869 RepID=UPI001F13CD23|nr:MULTISPECIES: class I SAM-dependent methyltransferase [unclassified Flavobacterium]UMY66359.1 class I SAM-dependent methyltransferase [Flavobacterium sp. HJ-32-4]